MVKKEESAGGKAADAYMNDPDYKAAMKELDGEFPGMKGRASVEKDPDYRAAMRDLNRESPDAGKSGQSGKEA
jgi:hypothetical protein